MSYVPPKPTPYGNERRQISKQRRLAAIDKSRPAVTIHSNNESAEFEGTWPTNFSKGLPHNAKGMVAPGAFQAFFAAINAPNIISISPGS